MVRAAVVYFTSEEKKKKMRSLCSSLAKGMESQGAEVKIFEVQGAEDIKLTGFSYIALGVDTTSWFKGKLPQNLTSFLGQSGVLTGKKAFAFTDKQFFGSNRTLLALMKVMEHEGMLLRLSEVLLDPEDAVAMGESLKLD